MGYAKVHHEVQQSMLSKQLEIKARYDKVHHFSDCILPKVCLWHTLGLGRPVTTQRCSDRALKLG